MTKSKPSSESARLANAAQGDLQRGSAVPRNSRAPETETADEEIMEIFDAIPLSYKLSQKTAVCRLFRLAQEMERKKMLEGTWASELRGKLWKGKSPTEILESDPIKEAEQRGYNRCLLEKVKKQSIDGDDDYRKGVDYGFQKGIDAVEKAYIKLQKNFKCDVCTDAVRCDDCDKHEIELLEKAIEAARKSKDGEEMKRRKFKEPSCIFVKGKMQTFVFSLPEVKKRGKGKKR